MYNAKILANLKSCGAKWVNPVIALSDIFGEDGSMESLNELIREGKVEKQMVSLGDDKFGQAISAPLYRVTPNYSLINTTDLSHLTLVK